MIWINSAWLTCLRQLRLQTMSWVLRDLVPSATKEVRKNFLPAENVSTQACPVYGSYWCYCYRWLFSNDACLKCHSIMHKALYALCMFFACMIYMIVHCQPSNAVLCSLKPKFHYTNFHRKFPRGKSCTQIMKDADTNGDKIMKP